MGRTKGGKNRYWSKEEKLRIVNRVIVDGLSTHEVSDLEKISNGMLNNWIKKYLEFGIDALENSKKPGNPLSKYQNRLDLKEIIEDIHSRKPNYGYRKINAKILQETGWKVSDKFI